MRCIISITTLFVLLVSGDLVNLENPSDSELQSLLETLDDKTILSEDKVIDDSRRPERDNRRSSALHVPTAPPLADPQLLPALGEYHRERLRATYVPQNLGNFGGVAADPHNYPPMLGNFGGSDGELSDFGGSIGSSNSFRRSSSSGSSIGSLDSGSNRRSSSWGSDRAPSSLGSDRRSSSWGSDRAPSSLGSDRRSSSLGSDRRPSSLGSNRRPSNLGSNRRPSSLGSNRRPSSLGSSGGSVLSSSGGSAAYQGGYGGSVANPNVPGRGAGDNSPRRGRQPSPRGAGSSRLRTKL